MRLKSGAKSSVATGTADPNLDPVYDFFIRIRRENPEAVLVEFLVHTVSQNVMDLETGLGKYLEQNWA